MSLVSSLLQGTSFTPNVDTTALEAKLMCVDESMLEAASAELMVDICAVNEAYLTADIIGSVKVVSEGADPAVLLENIITSVGERLKTAWNKFLAAVRKFFDKVITFFKSMVLTGEKFVKELGSKIKSKIDAIRSYEYEGYLYNESAGEAAYKSATKAIEDGITKYYKGFDSLTSIRDANATDLVIKDLGEDDDESGIVESVADNAYSGATTASDVKSGILEKYRNDTSKSLHKIGRNDVDKMLDVVKGAKKAIAAAKSDRDSMEHTILNIIGKCDNIGKNIKDDKEKSKVGTLASKLSRILNGILNLYRGAADARITYFKESNRHYLGVLRKLLNFGTAAESTMFEGCDADPDDAGDIDDDDIEFEVALASADEPEGSDGDIGLVKENAMCHGNNIVAEAMRYLG